MLQVQVKLPGVFAQVALTSQLSVPKLHSSSSVQTLGSPVHWYPVSTEHVAEQPSPGVVLLSSQVSLLSITPSPHTDAPPPEQGHSIFTVYSPQDAVLNENKTMTYVLAVSRPSIQMSPLKQKSVGSSSAHPTSVHRLSSQMLP